MNQNIIIVLGNSNPEIRTRRITRSIEEFRRLPNPFINEDTHEEFILSKILFSGGYGKCSVSSEAELMKKEAIELGLHERFIYVEEKSKNTIENLSFSKKIIDYMYLKPTFHLTTPTVTICTSTFHIKRSMILTKLLFGEVYPLRFIHTNEKVEDKLQNKEWNTLGYSLKGICENVLGF
jgi:uncharacterized SAM-binding protein YcdF (DUF218 family)